MSNNKKFVAPKEAVIMGSFLRREEPRVFRGGAVLPAIQKEVLVLAWAEEGRVREGILAESTLLSTSTTVEDIRPGRMAGDVAEIPDGVRVWHGAPDRSGEIFAEQTQCDQWFRYGGEVVGEFLRFVPISKSGHRKPRLIPFVVVRGGDGVEYICRVEDGQEWETTPGPLGPQLASAHKRLMDMYPSGQVTITPFGRGGYWQVTKDSVPAIELQQAAT
jgi:hypothetical protein